MGFVLPLALKLPYVEHYVFPRVSQLAIEYRSSALSEDGKHVVGSVRAGDRLPWLESADNFVPLRELRWQVHAIGEAGDDLRMWASGKGLPVFEFKDGEEARTKGMAKGAVYLVRPDGYVGCVTENGKGMDGLVAYAEKWLKA
jgi:hypothetical protein